MENTKGFMRLINEISRSSSAVYNAQLEDKGIVKWQHPYFISICKNPGITQEQLASALIVNPSTVTRQLTILENSHLIVKKQGNQDKRTLRIYPTDKMLELLPSVREVIRNFNENILLKGLSNEESELAYSLLSRIRDNASEAAREVLENRAL